MKQVNSLLTIFVIILSLIAVNSCGDPCKDINCNNNGTCVEGDCNCDPGYSGPLCSIQDLCFSVNCNNGTCVDGTCECDPGYGGDCTVILRTAYIDTYNAQEICSSDPSFTDNYTAEVKISSSGVQYMYITNLYNHFNASAPGAYQPEDTQVEVIVSTTGIEIPTQYWTATGLEDFRVSGTGTILNGVSFTISYTLEDTSPGGGSDNCQVTYELQ